MAVKSLGRIELASATLFPLPHIVVLKDIVPVSVPAITLTGRLIFRKLTR